MIRYLRYIFGCLRDALNDVKEMFVKTVLRDQDCFRHERGWDTLLALIPDKGESLYVVRPVVS